jgi:glycosyltransferase involved in cell wall biosynthesis
MERGIVMIGTGLDTRGGVSAVVRVYAEQGLLERHGVRYIATHCDGSKWRKLRQAVGAWLRYMGLLLRGGVALVHVHSASGPSFWRKSAFVLPSLLFGVPVVLHMHGGGFMHFWQRAHWPGRQALIRAVFERSAVVLALSDQWRAALQRLFPAARVRTLVNPVPLPADAAPLDGAVPTVLYMGLLAREKGVFELVEAWAQVQRACPSARLLLGGVGQDAALREAAQLLGVGESVELLGWVSGEEKQRRLGEAWVLALPSHAEALPMAVLEAMAQGVPVVASRVGGIPLAVREGQDGLLMEPHDVPALADALLRLLQDDELRRRMGASAREHVQQRFSAVVTLPQLSLLWEEVVGVPASENAR